MRHTRYRQAVSTRADFRPRVRFFVRAILKKRNAESMQCWLSFITLPRATILLLAVKRQKTKELHTASTIHTPHPGAHRQTNTHIHTCVFRHTYVHPYTLLIHILTHTHTQMTKRSQCKSTWECMYMCAEFSTAPTWLCTATVDGLSAYLLARWPLVSPSQAQQGTQDHLRTVFHLSRSRGGEGLEKE